jgi:hypothetical protein
MAVSSCGAALPKASNVNRLADRAIPNAVLAKVGAGSKTCC